jgi:hypothetical protein
MVADMLVLPVVQPVPVVCQAQVKPQFVQRCVSPTPEARRACDRSAHYGMEGGEAVLDALNIQLVL